MRAPGQLVQRFAALPLRERFLVGVACFTLLFAAIQVLMFGFGRDQGIYAAVGSGILRGEMPYRHNWDFKPPGIFLAHAFAELLFGHHMTASRLLEVLAFFGLTGVFVGLSQRYTGRRLPGLLGAALAFLVHSQMEFWHSGQPESFGGVLTAVALLLTSRPFEAPGRQFRNQLLIGVCFGLAFLMKPPLGGGAIVCAAYLGRRKLLRNQRTWTMAIPFAVVGVGSLLPIVACALWFVLRGAWPDLHWTLFEFTPGYTKLGWDGASPLGMFWYAVKEALKKFSWLIPSGLLLLFAPARFLPALNLREREGALLVLGVVAMQLSGVAMQAKFFSYHYGASVPLLCWVAGLGWYKLWDRARGLWTWPVVVAFFLLGAWRLPVSDFPGSYWQRSTTRLLWLVGGTEYNSKRELDATLYLAADSHLGANQDLAERFQELTTPSERIFIWGFEPSVYFLAERPVSSRFIYNVSQRVTWERDKSRELLLSELSAAPPKILAVQHHDVFPFVTGDTLDSARAIATFPKFERLLNAEYEPFETLQDFDLYRRRAAR